MSNLFNQYKYEPQNKSIIGLIKAFEKQYLPVFLSVKKEWNVKIRDFLRDATGLRLNQRRRSLSAPREIAVDIHFFPDYNDFFIKQVDNAFPDLDFNEYESIRELKIYLDKSKAFFYEDSAPYFYKLMSYCDGYLKEYDIAKIIATLFSETRGDGEVWGAYYYQANSIELYYLPLIVLSKISGISLEYAFVVVLAHELAHAYHHIGKDSDKRIWDAMPFADKEIKEGLAQYYTHYFVEEYKSSYPLLGKAFDYMLSLQSGAYIVHKNWLDHKKEAVKSGMIINRINNNKDYSKFLTEVKAIDVKLNK